MKLALREHQKHCVEVLWAKKYGMDCSDPGCGKTVTALALIEKSGLKAAVVVPAYLQRNWVNEVHRFTNLRAEVFNSKVKSYSADILIISYAMLEKAEKAMRGRAFLLADEAHYLANPTSKRTKAFRSFVKHHLPERMLLMSGTFLRNSVAELWSPLYLCDIGHDRNFRGHFKSHYTFKDTYMLRTEKRIYGRRIVDWEGSRNEESLRQWLDAYSVTIKLSQLSELPPLIQIPMLCAPPDPKLDAELMKAYQEYQDGVIGGGNIHSVKRASAINKAPFTLAFAEEQLAQGLGPLVVFTDHVSSAKLIAETLAIRHDVGLVYGEVAAEKRAALVQGFQDGRLNVIVATIPSMSLGVTLTRANIVIFNDKNFDPSANKQATGRVLRISQEADKVLCYEILREGVDERINELLESKLSITSSLMEEYEGADLDW